MAIPCGQTLLHRGIIAISLEKVSQLPINLQKPWNFSTSNDLQYMVFQIIKIDISKYL